VSRSGAVLAAARARGFSRPAAWSLVRETAVPVLVAASALKGVRALQRGADLRVLGAGTAAAACSTAVALRAGRRVERVPARIWALYRVAVAAAVLAVRETAAR
jgi:undecaprenyl-diphosphatase